MNQRLLLGSTALVGAGVLLTSPLFAQEVGGLEVSLGGYTEFLVEGATDETLTDGDSDRGYFFNHDTEIHIQAEGTTDGGVTYGSEIEIEAGALPMEADEMNLYFSGGFGRIELGRQDGVVDTMVLDATVIAAGTGGVDGDTDNLLTAGNIADVGDATKITYYTPRIAGFQLGGSFTPDSDDGLNAGTGALSGDDGDSLETVGQGGVNWEGEFGGLETGLFGIGTWANEEVTDDDVRAWAGGGLIGFGGLDFAASYGSSDFDNGDEIDFLLVGARFGFGPARVGFHYERDWIDGDPFGLGPVLADQVDDNNTYVVSADVGLMPGVTLKSDVSYTDSDPGAIDPGDETWAGVVAIQLTY